MLLFSVRFYVLTVRNSALRWSCSSSAVTASSPFFLNYLSPRFIDSCVRAQWIIVAWNIYLFVLSGHGFLLRRKLYVCSTVSTCISGCITFSFSAPSISVSVTASRLVPSTISRYASAMASSMSAMSSYSSVTPVLTDSVLSLSLSTPMILSSWRTHVISLSFSTPVLLVSFSSFSSSPASAAY